MFQQAAEVVSAMIVLCLFFKSHSLWSLCTDGGDEIRGGDMQIERGLEVVVNLVWCFRINKPRFTRLSRRRERSKTLLSALFVL